MEIELGINVNSRYGMNSVYAGKHWSKRKSVADEIHDIVTIELKRQKIPKKPYDYPVEITLYYNSRLDCDNHGYLTKMIIDGLKGWVIMDDSRKYVKRIVQEFFSGDGVIVKIKEYAK